MKRQWIRYALTSLLSLTFLTPVMACEGVSEPDAVAERMADLPIEVQASLYDITTGTIADYGTPLLQTDAPDANDIGKTKVRFSRGYLNGDRWIVFLDIAMMRDPRSLGFIRGDGGTFVLSAGYFLYGNECAVRRAIQDGVRNST